MTAIAHYKHDDFHWTPLKFSFALVLGVLATIGLWLFAGLLMTLFIM